MDDEQSPSTDATDSEFDDVEVDISEIDGSDEDDSTEEEQDVANSDDDSDSETESESDDTNDESTDDSEVAEETQSDEEKQKQANREFAERRIQEKKQKQAQLKDSQQEYVAQAEDEKDEALRQLQVDAYNNKVESNTNKLTNGYERAIKDFEILSDSSPEIKAEVDKAIDDFQALHVELNALGDPVDVREDLYSFLQKKADSIQKLTRIGARQETTAKAKSKSKTFTPPSRTPKEPKEDPDLAAFDEEAWR